ncbi:MAG: hypothetical protein ABMA02_03165 [Saprospiraceae bacterium]
MVYELEILNPEAKALLESLVRLRLIRFKPADTVRENILAPSNAEKEASTRNSDLTPEQAEAIRVRVAEVESGMVKTVPAETVKAKLIRKHGLQS